MIITVKDNAIKIWIAMCHEFLKHGKYDYKYQFFVLKKWNPPR